MIDEAAHEELLKVIQFVEASESLQDDLIPTNALHERCARASTDTLEVIVGIDRSQTSLAPDAVELLTRVTPRLQRSVILIPERRSMLLHGHAGAAAASTLTSRHSPAGGKRLNAFTKTFSCLPASPCNNDCREVKQ